MSPQLSVVIAAHNEAAVLGRCLDALLADRSAPTLDLTVVANGCTDATAAVAAQRPGVRVIELPEAGKAKALNAGDAAAVGFPRLYLDADIVLPPGSAGALAHALTRPAPDGVGPLAVVPRRHLDVRGRPLLVRGFYAINRRLPAYRDALFGRGAIALSATGRARFTAFPDLVADDLFLDSLFTPQEKREVPEAVATVTTPHRTRDLLRRLVRVRAGNRALRQAGVRADAGAAVRPADRSGWLRVVLPRRPWLAPAAACYVGLTVLAEILATRNRQDGWGRDESSRTELAAPPG